jgi:hypothetical protein
MLPAMQSGFATRGALAVTVLLALLAWIVTPDASASWMLVSIAIGVGVILLMDAVGATLAGAWKMSLRRPGRAHMPVVVGAAALSFVAAFFLAGALGVPLRHPQFWGLSLMTAGVLNIGWGVESVVKLGAIEFCTGMGGNCLDANVRVLALVTWPLLFAAIYGSWLVTRARRRKSERATISP